MCAGCGHGKPPVPAAVREALLGTQLGSGWSMRPCDTLVPSAKAGAQREPSCEPCKRKLQQRRCATSAFLQRDPNGIEQNHKWERITLEPLGLSGFPRKVAAERAVEVCLLHPPLPSPRQEAAGEERGNFHPASIWQTLHLCYNLG